MATKNPNNRARKKVLLPKIRKGVGFLGGLAVVGALVAGLLVFKNYTSSKKAYAAEPALSLPGQVGDAIAYTTRLGTPAWRYYVYAGGPADNYHYAQVILPSNFSTTTATPTVLVIHGSTATEDSFTKSANNKGGNLMLNSWIDKGWAVIATREGQDINPITHNGINGKWGNELSRQGMVDAWRWAQSAWTPDPHGFLAYGFSMGGLGGLNFAYEAQQQAVPVAALYMVDGATNLAYDYSHRSSFAINIRKAYNLPAKTVVGDAAWTAKVDTADGGHDPQKFYSSLTPFPLYMSASGNDPAVNKLNNSLLLYNTLAASGWATHAELGYWSYGGGHNASNHFSPSVTNPFFDRALQR